MADLPITPPRPVDPMIARGAQLDADTVVIDLTGPAPVVTTRDRLPALATVVDLRDRVGEKVSTRTRDGRWALVLLLVALNVADVVTTKLVLAAGGTEGNPLMASVVTDGWAGPLGMKLLVCAAIAACVARCPRESKMVPTALTVVTGIYVAIIGWNLAILTASV
jgi:hypothetical protein